MKNKLKINKINNFSVFSTFMFVLYIFSLFIKVPLNIYTQIIFAFIIITSAAFTLKIAIDIVKSPLSKFEYKNYIIPILYFLISVIISVPLQIHVVSDNFNEYHCLPMILLHLLWIILFSSIATNTYIKLRSSNKIITFIPILLLIWLVLCLLVSTMLIIFGVYWIGNFDFILLNQ